MKNILVAFAFLLGAAFGWVVREGREPPRQGVQKVGGMGTYPSVVTINGTDHDVLCAAEGYDPSGESCQTVSARPNTTKVTLKHLGGRVYTVYIRPAPKD